MILHFDCNHIESNSWMVEKLIKFLEKLILKLDGRASSNIFKFSRTYILNKTTSKVGS